MSHELQIMPNAAEIEFKEKFVQRYEKLTDFEAFKKYSLSFPRRSIRVNTLKISVAELKVRLEAQWDLTPVPWCKEGFWIEHKGIGEEKRRDVGNLLEHVLGYIYIQEASSMIPPIVLAPKEHELVLDMCSAPGSKASQIAQYMNNTGILVANDYKGDRLQPLGINLQRMGVTSQVITLMQGHWFKEIVFDRILVDAPCSGTGTINKSIKTLRIWNPQVVKRLSGAQKQLLQTGFNCLKPGGTIVYSTCTLEPEEDEAVVSSLLENNPNAEMVPVSASELPGLKRSLAVTSFEGVTFHPDVKHCIRIWPQDNYSEGFFVARMRKKE